MITSIFTCEDPSANRSSPPPACGKRRLNGDPSWINPPQPLHVLRGDSMAQSFGRDRNTDAPCQSRCGTIKNPPCSKNLSAEHRSKFCSPSLAMVTSPYKWKIHERDVLYFRLNWTNLIYKTRITQVLIMCTPQLIVFMCYYLNISLSNYCFLYVNTIFTVHSCGLICMKTIPLGLSLSLSSFNQSIRRTRLSTS
jgi:hypothetical protein